MSERVAVIADIHGNLPALEAALERIDRTRDRRRSTAAATSSATAPTRTRSAA